MAYSLGVDRDCCKKAARKTGSPTVYGDGEREDSISLYAYGLSRTKDP